MKVLFFGNILTLLHPLYMLSGLTVRLDPSL